MDRRKQINIDVAETIEACAKSGIGLKREENKDTYLIKDVKDGLLNNSALNEKCRQLVKRALKMCGKK